MSLQPDQGPGLLWRFRPGPHSRVLRCDPCGVCSQSESRDSERRPVVHYEDTMHSAIVGRVEEGRTRVTGLLQYAAGRRLTQI
jgi:hypothetical protein